MNAVCAKQFCVVIAHFVLGDYPMAIATVGVFFWLASLICVFVLKLFLEISKRYCANMRAYMPKPMVIALPNFKGRILSGVDCGRGVVVINLAFCETVSWGSDAILVPKIDSGIWGDISRRRVVLEAYRPDPITPGLFQCVSERYKRPEDWGKTYFPGRIEIWPETKEVLVHPCFDTEKWEWPIWASGTLAALFFLIGMVILIVGFFV